MKKILVIDDNADCCKPLAALLQRDGFDARYEVDGTAGLATAKQWKPDAILLDVMMPGIDGMETLRRMKLQGVTAKIIMFSAISEEERIQQAKRAGASGWLVKSRLDYSSLSDLIAAK